MSRPKSTTFYPRPEDKARLAEIRQKTAIIESRLLGRHSDGMNMSDVFHAGVEAVLASVGARWTPEDEAALRAGLTSRRDLGAAALDAARAEGFGPDTPQEQKIAKVAGLFAAGVSEAQIGELFGVSQQRVNQWLKKPGAAKVPPQGRKTRARGAGNGAVKHATPGRVPFLAPEAKP